MISGKIKVEISVITGQARRLRQKPLIETLIIQNSAKTESNNCFFISIQFIILQIHVKTNQPVGSSCHVQCRVKKK